MDRRPSPLDGGILLRGDEVKFARANLIRAGAIDVEAETYGTPGAVGTFRFTDTTTGEVWLMPISRQFIQTHLDQLGKVAGEFYVAHIPPRPDPRED